MVETVAIAFVTFVLAVVGMAVGAIFKGRHLTGSCGGLSKIDGAGECDICGRDMSREPDAASNPCVEQPADHRRRL